MSIDRLYAAAAALFLALGLYFILSARFPAIYGPAKKALRARAPKRLTQSQVMQNELADRIAPLLDLDPIRRSGTEMLLKNLGHSESPELFHACAIARSLFAAGLCSVMLLFSVPVGSLLTLACGVWYYRRQSGALERELEDKRLAIERELPQFASTISQSLGTTRDVVAILRSYRRVCAPTLAGEIDKTLNNVMTGNPERAIHALETRVASAKLSQLTRGLLAVMRGDDQRQYFAILAEEYRKAQDEAIERELLARPHKLYPYMGVLFLFLCLMIAVTVGTDLVQSLQNLS